MKKLYLLLLLCSACSSLQDECPDGYMAQKQTVVTPSGIVTQPNEYGQLPPGTLRVGDNICIRKQGVIEPRPAFEDYGDLVDGVPDIFGALKIWPLASENVLVLVGGENSGTPKGVFKTVYADGTQSEFAGLNTDSLTLAPGKTQITRTRDRTIVVAENNAPKVIADSDIGTTGGGTITARKAGLPMPSFVKIDLSTAGSVLPAHSFVSYRVVFRRTLGAYTFQGAVSAAYPNLNDPSADSNPQLTVYWDKTNTPLIVGDQLEVFRTETVDDLELVGDRHRYAFAYVLTSSDITAGQVTLLDTAISLGADLYYNGSQEGAALNNYMPPVSTDVVTFKGATFYNSTSSWHSRALAGKYHWGEVGLDDLSYGIGEVEETGTWTSGSSTITITTALPAGVNFLVVGMELAPNAYFPTGTKILTKVGNVLTVSNVSSSARTDEPIVFFDVIEINGVRLSAATTFDFLQALADANSAGTVPVVALPDFKDPENVQLELLLPVSGTGPFTIRATHGDRYTPPLPEITATAETSTNDPRTNRLYYSKIDQPENVGPASYLFVGHGTILKMFATQESLLVFCSDGIRRVTGDGDDFSEEPFDPDTILLAPDAADSMDNTIYALTTAGFVSVNEQGVQKISSPLIGNDYRALWKHFQPVLPYTFGLQVACDKYRNEVWLNFNGTTDDLSDYQKTYIWNTDTSTFATQSDEESIAVGYVPALQSIVVGEAVTSPLNRLQLRKYSDVAYMSSRLELNPVYGDDVGYLKQWMDVALFFQDVAGTFDLTPAFEATDYPAGSYVLAPNTNFEEVCAVLQDFAYNKHCRFGFALDGTSHWSLLGLTFRYRTASETLRA